MASLVERVQRYLEDDAWDVEVGESPGLLWTAAAAENGEVDVLVVADDEMARLAVYAISREKVPAERIDAVSRFVCRANYGLAVGNLELDLDDGELRSKASLDLDGLALSDDGIGTLLGVAIDLIDHYGPFVADVVGGDEPDDAARAAED